jgi:hypothetical protein
VKDRNFITLLRTPASHTPGVTIDTQGAPLRMPFPTYRFRVIGSRGRPSAQFAIQARETGHHCRA